MEGVAAAASVAGILALAGQSIDGIKKLRDFFSDIGSASKTVDIFLRDINGLLEVLQHVTDLLAKIPEENTGGNVASLHIELEDCSNDVFAWLETARDLRPGSDKGGKRWFKILWLAVNKKSVQDIRKEMDRHRRAISLGLSVLEGNLNLQTAQYVRKIDEKVNYITSMSLSHDKTVLERIENNTISSMHSSAGSMKSLESMASRLEALTTSLTSSPNSQFGGRTSPYSFISREGSSAGSVGSSRPLSLRDASRNSNLANSTPGVIFTLPASWNSTGASQHSSPSNSRISGDIREPDNQEYICQCCPENPKIFLTKVKLSAHMDERPYSCRCCPERFKYPNQAKYHRNSRHPVEYPEATHQLNECQFSWSCAFLAGCYDAAFYRPNMSTSASTKKLNTTASASTTGMTCCYCGKEFFDNPESEWHAMISHLDTLHNFGKCKQGQYIHRPGFLHHLEIGHNIVRGNWTEFLFEACMKEIPPRTIPGPGEKLQMSYLRFTLPSLYRDLQSYTAGCPTLIGNYISLSRMIMLFQGQLALLNQTHIAKGSTKTSVNQTESGSSETNTRECNFLRRKLDILQKNLEVTRKQCLLDGYSFNQIDQCLSNHTGNSPSAEPPGVVTRTGGHHYDMFEIRKQTLDAGLLGIWSSTRDRINRWLLHSLRSDDKLAQLHRSMLTEKNLDEKAWARLLLKYWYIDEAAVGIELQASLSLGAVDSREFSSLESADFYTCVESETDHSLPLQPMVAKLSDTELDAEKVHGSDQDEPENIRVYQSNLEGTTSSR